MKIDPSHCVSLATRSLGLSAMAILIGLNFTSISMGQEPEPFRRGNDLTGRSSPLRNRGSIHALTFDYRPIERQQRLVDPTGFRTSFGSTGSKEFTVDTEWQRTWILRKPWNSEARVARSEDLDGTYERILTGIGYMPADTWRFVILGDIVSDKKNIDAHLEAQWRPHPRHYLRMAGLAVDLTYRGKGDCGDYDTLPYTYFSQYTGQPRPDTLINAWVNYNPDVVFNSYEHELVFLYRQTSAGLDVVLPLNSEWRATIESRHVFGARRWNAIEDAERNGRFDRQSHQLGAEIWHEPENRVSGWYGMQLVWLDETQDGTPLGFADQRREALVFGGVLVPVSRWNAVFRPGLYASYIDKYKTSGLENDDKERRDFSSHILKAAFPLTIEFDEGRTLTLNATFVSDRRTGFGGGNIRCVFPF